MKKNFFSVASELAQTIGLAFVLFLIIYFLLARPFQVSGYSMYPTYKDHEYLLTNIIGLRLNGVKRGDVIVFKAPVDQAKDYIKRIIALPGDKILLKEGKIYLNDKVYDESPYLNGVKTAPGNFLEEGKTVTVSKDHFIVMGDNRPGSSDSREWGFITRGEIIGKALFVYWPITSWRLISNPVKAI